MKIYLQLLILIFALQANAQNDSVLLTKNFKFEDGIYLTLQDFQQNKPNYTWNEVSTNLATSHEGFIAQVEAIKIDGHSLDLQQLWGICIGGIPYIRLSKGEVTEAATVFAGLRVRGKICYFGYQQAVTEMQLVKAYNPLTGRAFRQGKIPVEKTMEYHFLLNFQTGQVAPFTKNNFLAWIEDDQQLWTTVQELSSQEAQDKLFKCLLIYVDRNTVHLPFTN